MATKPETVFRARVRKYLADLVSRGFPLWYEPIQQKAIKGTPDFVLCANGHFIGLELKSEEGTISKLQEEKRAGILEAGGLYLVAYPDNWETVQTTIEFYLGETNDECQGTHEVA